MNGWKRNEDSYRWPVLSAFLYPLMESEMMNYGLRQSHRFTTAISVAFLFAVSIGISQSRPESSNQNASILHPVGDYPLPGKATRWDYMSLDTTKSRLFLAHLGDSSVVAVDTKTKAVVGTVANVGQVHGVLAIPELGRVYATATKTNEVVSIDATNLKITARIPAGIYPDGLAYAPEVRKLYVSDEEGKTETVIDVQSNERIASIPLGGSVGNTQYDAASKHIFVNVQGTAELIEIDPVTNTIVQRIPVPGAEGNHGLLIVPTLRLAFIACEGNDKLLVMDLRNKKIVYRFNVGKGLDVPAYDAGLGLLYLASESGLVSEFKVSSQGVTKIGEGLVGPNAHTVAVDPKTHEVYFPLKEVGGRPVLRVMRPSI
jgi:YVTN family beta-propeller protein